MDYKKEVLKKYDLNGLHLKDPGRDARRSAV